MLLFLTACATRLGVPDVAYATPEPIPIVRTSIDRRWYVPMEIEGEQWVWFFDTGYSHSTCDDGLIEALGLPTVGRSKVRGELGTLSITKARLPPFTFGGHAIDGLTCQVRDLHSTSSIRDPREVRIAGVIGIDLLRPFVVVMDPVTNRVTLLEPTDERLDPKAADVVRLRRELWIGTRVKMPVVAEDKTLWPIVDTGASTTYLDLRSVELRPSEVRDGVMIRGTGAGGHDLRRMEYFDLALGIASGWSPPVRISQRDHGDGLLGLDVLSSYRVRYDFRRGLAEVLPVRGAEPTRWSEWRAAYTSAPGMVLDLPGPEE